MVRASGVDDVDVLGTSGLRHRDRAATQALHGKVPLLRGPLHSRHCVRLRVGRDLGSRPAQRRSPRAATLSPSPVTLSRLLPGTGGDDFPLGPLMVEPQTAETVIAPTRPSSLCGRAFDWAEVVPYS
jgi:hypothetical protein